MKVDVHGWHTDIYLDRKEVKELCDIGAGDNTCIFLLCGNKGFQCAMLHGSLIPSRMYNGEGSAKRQGCDFIDENVIPMVLGEGIHNIEYK